MNNLYTPLGFARRARARASITAGDAVMAHQGWDPSEWRHRGGINDEKVEVLLERNAFSTLFFEWVFVFVYESVFALQHSSASCARSYEDSQPCRTNGARCVE